MNDADDGDEAAVETRRACLVDAFTDEPLRGNAAGVVPDAAGLTDEQMQSIARELGASETAFLRPSEEADRRVRYFTPETEVDLCGHATIGSHALLYADSTLEAGTHTLATNVGVLEIEVESGGRVWMTQDDPEIREVEIGYDRLGSVLGIDPEAMRDVGADLPVAHASTGLPFLVVPVNFLEHVGNADPDMRAIEELSDEFGVAGVYVFTFDTLDAESTLHARMFAPGAGVPEDPVTGTASGAAGAYLDRFGAVDTDAMRFEQGHFLDRDGTVHVEIGERVRVGGDAVVSFEGRLLVPAASEDEILEI
ncbi:PhzF family phenazine biosynthesis protein [Salinirubellus sp. GCM10025818]|uniref:PhzF family phenazine biosynthesis protein n=1 Tax=Salinirubellus TaxID=2162630 RepID=UPI0030D4E9EF